MARSWRPSLLGLSLMATASLAQTTSHTTAAVSSTSTPSTPHTATTTSVDVALSLWGDANSLISSYYPSTTITDVRSLSWPATVVIGSSTYSVHPAAATTTQPSSTPTSASDTKSTADIFRDKKIGIIIGVIVGLIAFAIMGVIFFCLWRRKRNTGAYFRRRGTPSIADSEIGAWRDPNTATLPFPDPSYEGAGRYSRLPQQSTAPMATTAAYTPHYDSSRSTSDDNPFFTPEERGQLDAYPFSADDVHHSAAIPNWPPQRKPLNVQRSFRTPEPIMPTIMTSLQSDPQQHQQQYSAPQHSLGHDNPFTSPYDEAADVVSPIVSPIVPTRSPERRHSPAIHYPSWDEVSEFDFAGDGRRSRIDWTTSSSEDSADFQRRRRRESVVGRHELA